MAMVKINLVGKEYPCRVTMGAMIRFRDTTGHDVSELQQTDVEGLCKFVYCCVKSACHVDKEDFDMDFQTFADSLDAASLNEFYTAMAEGQKN